MIASYNPVFKSDSDTQEGTDMICRGMLWRLKSLNEIMCSAVVLLKLYWDFVYNILFKYFLLYSL